MMAGDRYRKFTCSFRAKDGAESGSGIIVQIGREDLHRLLQEPSCLKTKVGEKLSADKTCYALITAHSCVYAPDTPDTPAVERLKLAGRKIVVGNQFEIPIEDCSCAVSCCGKDSIMRLTEDKTDFTLMPHTRECHIGFDFLILFLRADAVNKKKPTRYPDPPILSLFAQRREFPTTSPFKASMYWCSGGMVRKADKLISPSMKQDASAPEGQRLRDEVDSFLAKRSCAYQEKGVEPQTSQLGGPVVRSNCLIGINIGEKLTTVHGMVELLKGGLMPFLAVMRHSHARSLRTSKWKEHVLPHLRSQKPCYMWDLLHHLLEKSDFRILEINCGDSLEDIVSGLEILTAVFNKLKGSGPSFRDYHCHSDGEECKCVSSLYSDTLKQYLVHFARDTTGEHATKIVEALFQCFESMMNCESITRDVLHESMDNLIGIATSQLYGSNPVVNQCFKTIYLKERSYMIEYYRRIGQMQDNYSQTEHADSSDISLLSSSLHWNPSEDEYREI